MRGQLSRMKRMLRWFVLPAALMLVSSQVFGYALQYAKNGDVVRWNESCFYYSLHQSGMPGQQFSAVQEAVRESFAAWEEAGGCSYFYFEETAPASCDHVGFCQYGGNMNLLVWQDSDWEVDKFHVENAMALTTLSYDDANGQILDADIEFNSEFFDFGLNGEPHLADVRNTATHEIGHMLGLDHSMAAGSTMNPSAQPGDVDKRDLTEDDIAGICELYPLNGDPNVCEPPYNGLSLDCSSVRCNEPMDSSTGGICSAAPGIGSSNKGRFVTLLTLILDVL